MGKKSNVSLKNYSKKFKTTLFNNINIELTGSTVGLIGENGTGKTTLMKDLYQTDPFNIAYIEQNFNFFENATGKQNIELLCQNIDDDLLKKLNIDTIYLKKVKHMSAGERQRLLCYIALKTSKNWIFMDEIDNHLDALNARNFYSLLKNNKQHYFLISHHPEWIEKECQQLFIIKNQKVLEIKKEEKNLSYQQNTQKKRSLMKMFLFKSYYFFFLLLNVFLMILSLFFYRYTSSNFLETSYYSNPLYLQVYPIIKKDNVSFPVNFTTLETLKTFDDLFKDSYLDLNSFFSSSDGIYVNEKKLTEAYLDQVYDFPLNFYDKKEAIEIYVSNQLQDTILDGYFKIDKILQINNKNYTIKMDILVHINGYLDITINGYVYHDEQMQKVLNHYIKIDNIDFFDYLKLNPIVLNQNFKNLQFVSILKQPLIIENIDKTMQKEGYEILLYSSSLTEVKNEYLNWVSNKLLINILQILIIFLLFFCNLFYLQFYFKKQKKKFESFAYIMGVHSIDVVLKPLLLVFLFMPLVIILVLFLNTLLI